MELKHNHVMEKPLLGPTALKNWKARLAAFFSKKMFGRVLSPIPILYARNPAILSFALKIESTFGRKLKLGDQEKIMVRLLVSMENGCSFCGDMALAQAFQKKLSRQRFIALVNGTEDSADFSEAEKTLIRFVKRRMEGHVSASLIDEMRSHFSERQIADIGWCIAAETYYNTLALTFSIESDGLVASSASTSAELQAVS
ncbi:MAG: hypothetical protein CMF59_08040 [Leptospiraceae bacterium]|nr:hypothetical protein [Leptospiraceae bacterium]